MKNSDINIIIFVFECPNDGFKKGSYFSEPYIRYDCNILFEWDLKGSELLWWFRVRLQKYFEKSTVSFHFNVWLTDINFLKFILMNECTQTVYYIVSDIFTFSNWYQFWPNDPFPLYQIRIMNGINKFAIIHHPW